MIKLKIFKALFSESKVAFKKVAFLGKGLKPLFSTCKRIALLEYSMVSIHLTKNEFGFFSTINNLFKYFTCNNLPIGNELFLQAIKCVTTASF